jgi:ABC-type sugar transport system ATPase subunit
MEASELVVASCSLIADHEIWQDSTATTEKVLGVVGLVGAGRTELARIIYGADQGASGTIEVSGNGKEIRSPRY